MVACKKLTSSTFPSKSGQANRVGDFKESLLRNSQYNIGNHIVKTDHSNQIKFNSTKKIFNNVPMAEER